VLFAFYFCTVQAVTQKFYAVLYVVFLHGTVDRLCFCKTFSTIFFYYAYFARVQQMNILCLTAYFVSVAILSKEDLTNKLVPIPSVRLLAAVKQLWFWQASPLSRVHIYLHFWA
jgi:hypothetical protein